MVYLFITNIKKITNYPTMDDFFADFRMDIYSPVNNYI